jgi:D-3-phosphoglycerate dehydrogenase
MKVLIADTFESSGIDALRSAGFHVDYQPDLGDARLAQALNETAAEVLVVRSTQVTAPMLESEALSLIVRAGAGYNTIDVTAASKRGIYVSNCPGKNAIAVAELAFALLLAMDRRLPDNVADLRAGAWNKKEYANARGIFGRTIGLIGYGSIGQEMARRAHAFGMTVVVWSRRFSRLSTSSQSSVSSPISNSAADVPIEIAGTPEEAAERCDALSIHIALTPETRGFVGARVLDKLKPGSFVINTARAEIVDHAALERVVREKNIRVGLDVFPNEPAGTKGTFSDPFLLLPGVYGTHHIGASTEQAQEAIAAEAVRIIAAYRDTGRVPNVVNLAKKTPATHMLVVRHRDRPGVLAHVFDRLRSGKFNVQETENIIFEGAHAAVARINLDGAPSGALLAEIQRGSSDILDLHVVTI